MCKSLLLQHEAERGGTRVGAQTRRSLSRPEVAPGRTPVVLAVTGVILAYFHVNNASTLSNEYIVDSSASRTLFQERHVLRNSANSTVRLMHPISNALGDSITARVH